MHPAPKHIFNLYVDNNEKFYDPDLTVDLEYVKQFLFHIKEIISSDVDDVCEYVMSWIAHKVQRPDKKIETCLLLMSPEQGTGKSIFTEILNALTGDYLISVEKVENLKIDCALLSNARHCFMTIVNRERIVLEYHYST